MIFARSATDEAAQKPLDGRANRSAKHQLALEHLWRLLLERAVRTASGIEDAKVRLVTSAAFDQTYQVGMRWLDEARLDVRAHRGATQSARKVAAIEDAFADGFTDVVLMAADVPALTTFDLESAFAALTREPRAAVLGPADDGGLYLIGLRAPCEAALHAPAFFAARAALQANGFETNVLRTLGDIDEMHDVEVELARLCGQVHPADVELRTALQRVTATAIEVAPAPRLPRSSTRIASMLN